MKRVWIVAGIVLLILTAGFLSLWHLKQVSHDMDASLSKLSELVTQQNASRLVEEAEAFEGFWEEKESVMMRYIHHDELDAITGTVARLKALAQYKDYSEMAAEIDRLRHLILHIYESEVPSFKTIF